jgi:hypothetical protein
MDQVAVFVDAGYLFAQGSALLAGRKLNRGEISLGHDAAIRSLTEFAERVSGLRLLRIYWYDGTSTGPTVGTGNHSWRSYFFSFASTCLFVSTPVAEQNSVGFASSPVCDAMKSKPILRLISIQS